MKKKLTVRNMVMIALFAAILCVSAYISIPLPNGSHITFLNFIVMIVSLIFGWQEAGLIVLVWLLLGAVGVPVFIGGNAGLGYLIGPYGGYSVGFLVVAILLPLIRGKKYNRIYYTIISVIGAILVDVVGAAWWMVVGSLSLKQALLAGVVAFLPLDLVKAVVAAQIVPVFRKLMPADVDKDNNRTKNENGEVGK